MKKYKKLPLIAVILVLTAICAISVSAIQRSNSSDGPLTGQLSDSNASYPNSCTAYGDSQTTSIASTIYASVTIKYNYPGQYQQTASRSRTNLQAKVAGASVSSPSGTNFLGDSSSHSATVNGIGYSCSNIY